MKYFPRMCVLFIVLFISLFLLGGCASLRTEFYRGETLHLYKQGCEAYGQADYDKAAELYSRVVELDPDYGPAHAGLGNVALIDQDFEKAGKHYRQAVECDPELEAKLHPLMFSSNLSATMQPLVESGINLADIYPPFMEEKTAEVERLVKGNVPLNLLAKDSISITPGKLGELRLKALELAPDAKGTARYRLLLAYLLFYGENDDRVVLDLLQRTIPETREDDRRRSNIIYGRTLMRSDRPNGAVDAFLAAVAAGSSMADVAPFLARLYKTDIQSILAMESKTTVVSPPDQEPINITATILPSPSNKEAKTVFKGQQEVELETYQEGTPAGTRVLIKKQ